jgi:hypothetical protein
VDIVLYAVLGSAFFILTISKTSGGFLWLLDWLKPEWMLPALTIAASVSYLFYRRPRTEKPILFRSILYYPSWLTAVLLGLGVIALWVRLNDAPKFVLYHELCALKLTHPTNISCSWIPSVIIIAIATLVVFIRARQNEKRDSAAGTDARRLEDLTLNRLKQWLSDDKEISSPDDDLFRSNLLAERIAKLIQPMEEAAEQSNINKTEKLKLDKSPSIAIRGALGSGKSTLCRLVDNHLQKLSGRKRHEMVFISVWAFESSDAAVSGILNELLRALSKHVSTLPIRGLSGQYLKIMSGIGQQAGEPWKTMSEVMINPSGNPADVLSKLDEVLISIDLRFVLVIEDMERFASHSERDLSSIHSLLWQLDRRQNIKVIVASTSLEDRFDIDKIARHVIAPPTLKPRIVWGIVDRFRQGCLSEFPDLILPEPNKDLTFKMPDDSLTINYEMRMRKLCGDGMPIIIALAVLLETPRSIKMALRKTLADWREFPGELDLDELIAVNAIRVAEPKAYSFLDASMRNLSARAAVPAVYSLLNSFIRNLSVGEQSWSDNYSAFVDELKRCMGNADESRKEAVCSLVRNHLLHLNINGIHKTINGSSSSVAQIIEPAPMTALSLSECRHIDNWEKFSRGFCLPNEESVQAVLRAIRDWESEQSEQLLHDVFMQLSLSAMEVYEKRLSGHGLLRLLERVVLDSFEKEENVDMLVSVLHKFVRDKYSIDTKQRSSVIQTILKECARKDLGLAIVIRQGFWQGNSTNYHPEELERFNAIFWKTVAVIDTFESFRDALSKTHPQRLRDLVYRWDNDRQSDNPSWQPIVDSLIQHAIYPFSHGDEDGVAFMLPYLVEFLMYFETQNDSAAEIQDQSRFVPREGIEKHFMNAKLRQAFLSATISAEKIKEEYRAYLDVWPVLVECVKNLHDGDKSSGDIPEQSNQEST